MKNIHTQTHAIKKLLKYNHGPSLHMAPIYMLLIRTHDKERHFWLGPQISYGMDYPTNSKVYRAHCRKEATERW